MSMTLIVILSLLVVAIVADGLRRVHIARKHSLKMSLRHLVRDEDDEMEQERYGSELPNGGARVRSKGESEDDQPVEAVELESPLPVAQVKPERVEPFVGTEQLAKVSEAEPVEEVSVATPELPASEEQQELFSVEPLQELEKKAKPKTKKTRSKKKTKTSTPAPIQEVIVVHVLAKTGQLFAGKPLLHTLLGCGLRFGEMNIFHRYEQESGEGKQVFSVANAIEPGTFDLEQMEGSTTRGVTIFMQLPGPMASLQALNIMINSAQRLAEDLDGELKDENRSVMTAQTIEHLRQRVQDFERKQQLLLVSE